MGFGVAELVFRARLDRPTWLVGSGVGLGCLTRGWLLVVLAGLGLGCRSSLRRRRQVVVGHGVFRHRSGGRNQAVGLATGVGVMTTVGFAH